MLKVVKGVLVGVAPNMTLTIWTTFNDKFTALSSGIATALGISTDLAAGGMAVIATVVTILVVRWVRKGLKKSQKQYARK